MSCTIASIINSMDTSLPPHTSYDMVERGREGGGGREGGREGEGEREREC